MTVVATPGIHNRRSHHLVERVRGWFGSPQLYRFLSLVGVPLTVIMLTGGVSTLGFWISSVLLLGVVFTFGAMPGAMLLLLPTVLLGSFLTKILPRWEKQASSVVRVAPWLLSGTFVFLTQDSLIADGVRLPTNSVQLGVLLVVSVAGLVSWGLLGWSDRLDEVQRESERQLRVVRALAAQHSPEPADEFWTTEPVVAWRMWRWDGSTLMGMRVAWESSDLVAECDTCVEPPGWRHTCGIYALFSPDQPWASYWADPLVVGRVELTGLVIEHDEGYRASRARITELQVASPDIARALGEKYPNVDIRINDRAQQRRVS